MQQTSDTSKIVVAITDTGMYYYLPLHILPETKWKDVGSHIGQYIKGSSDEKFIFSTIIDEADRSHVIFFATKMGMVKRSFIEDFHLQRFKKQATAMKLKDNDQLIYVGQSIQDGLVSLVSREGNGLTFSEGDVPITGLKAAGVIGMKLSKDDAVCGALRYDKQDIVLVTERGVVKRFNKNQLVVSNRANKGQLWIKKIKSNPLVPVGLVPYDKNVRLYVVEDGKFIDTSLSDLQATDFSSVGTQQFNDHVSLIGVMNVENISSNLMMEPVIENNEVVDVRRIYESQTPRNFTIEDYLLDEKK